MGSNKKKSKNNNEKLNNNNTNQVKTDKINTNNKIGDVELHFDEVTLSPEDLEESNSILTQDTIKMPPPFKDNDLTVKKLGNTQNKINNEQNENSNSNAIDEVNSEEDDDKKIFSKLKVLFTVSILIALVVLIAVMWFVPYRLTVERKNTLYQYENLTKDDIVVTCKSFLGKSKIINDYEIKDPILYNEATNITITYKNLTTTVSLPATAYYMTIVDYKFPKKVYQGDIVDKSKLHVWYCYENGEKRDQKDYTITDNPNYMNSNRITVKTNEGVDSVKCDKFIPIETIKPLTDIKAFVGDKVKKDYFSKYSFKVSFDDKTSKVVSGSEIIPKKCIINSGENLIKYSYHDSEHGLTVTGREKKYTVKVDYDGEQYVGDPLDFDELIINYEDSTSKTLKYNEVKLNEDTTLKYGTNNFSFSLNKQTIYFSVEAVEHEIASIELDEKEYYIGTSFYPTSGKITFSTGETRNVEAYEFGYADTMIISNPQTITLTYHNRSCDVTINPVEDELESINIDNSIEFYENSTVPNYTFILVYKSGKTEYVTASELGIEGKQLELGDNKFNIEYGGITKQITLTAIPNDIVSTTYDKSVRYYEGDSVYKMKLYIVYSDGTTETVTANKVNIISGNKNLEVLQGKNKFTYEYKGKKGSFIVTASKKSIMPDDTEITEEIDNDSDDNETSKDDNKENNDIE